MVPERIGCVLRNIDLHALSHHSADGRWGVEDGRQTVVGRRHPEVFGVIGPPEPDVVLAAAITPRVVRDERPAVLEVVFPGAVAGDQIGRRQVVKALEIRRHRGGKGIEGDLLRPVRPNRVAGDPEEGLETCHELHHGAGFGTLAGVDLAGPDVLVGSEHPSGLLSVLLHELAIVSLDRLEVFPFPGLLIVDRRLADAHGDVDAVINPALGPVFVPVQGQDGRGPVRGPFEDPAGEVEKEVLAGPVVKPVDALEIVPAPELLPAPRKKVVDGDVVLILEIAAHERDDPAVPGDIIIALQGEQHDHVRPKVAGRLVVGRAEPAVRLLGLEDIGDPALGLLADGGILQKVAKVAVPPEPIRQFLPALALEGDPAAVLL
jgi:hypothetical protein